MDACEQSADLNALVTKAITSAGGIRRSNKIAVALVRNLAWLGAGDGWERLLTTLRDLESNHSAGKERELARFLAETFHEVGPKQSRNILQMLGLTLFEIPLDSRLTKWLNAAGFPVQLNATLLADEAFYSFVMDAVILLCGQIDVLPCLLDAAVFASTDKAGTWTPGAVRW